jgi:hypothetical protein
MNMEPPPQQTREAWLNYVAQRMAPMFERLGSPLPTQLRIAIGFTSSGRRSRHIGECWDNQCSEDRHFEIFIRPDLSESKELLPMQVASILGHELVHAAVGVPAGHRKEFRRVARGIGLTGQMSATTPGAGIRGGVAADTAGGGAVAAWQTELDHWRQQSFQPAQKAALQPDQVCV